MSGIDEQFGNFAEASYRFPIGEIFFLIHIGTEAHLNIASVK